MRLSATSGSWTVTTAGKTINAVVFGFSASTATWTLGDALTCVNAVTVTYGTFTTNNYAVTAVSLVSTNVNTRAINLGSSTLSLSNTVSFSISTGLTLNAGTSQINLSNTGLSFSGGGLTFYNLTFTSTAANNLNIVGANTFNNISVTGPASAGVTPLTFDSRTTISGTLSTTGTAGNRRVWFRGTTYGLAQTLTVNSAASLTDADFRDIYVIGTSAPISGTRIGNLGGCSGITFDTAKTVYWNLSGAQDWSANGWAATSGGSPNTDNFPLAQDTAKFDNTGSVTGTISFSTTFVYTGTVDMSTRTSAMTLSIGTGITVYGDWKNGSGTTLSGANAITFSGRNTQTITSASKTFSGSITVDSYGGTVQLADDLNNGTSNVISVTNGTFDTKNFNVTTGGFSSNNNNVRSILLGSSTVSIASTVFSLSSTNLTFSSGTSQITMNNTAAFTFTGGSQTFYNVSFTGASTNFIGLADINTFNNLSFTAPSSAGIRPFTFSANQTITGTLTVAGATAVRRVFVRSGTLGTSRTITANSLSATDCDFRDITIAGAAAGSSPTRAGDCGGNTGITFPGAKTVYWNLAGTNSWTATAWCPSSGGTPDINQFPLAQDTAVINDAGAVTQITNSTVNVGAIDFSTRTTAVALALDNNFNIYGNITLSSAVTLSGVSGQSFFGRGTTTITSAGKAFLCGITIDCVTGTVQLADAFTSFSLNLNGGTFDAVTYNVTLTSSFSGVGAVAPATLKMGSGTWTLSGTGTVWGTSSVPVFYKGTANIVLSNTSASARTFNGNSLSYNKLTIGGTTGTSTTTIAGDNQFTELASTKTVAHTIALSTTTQTLGAWTVTGTVGNVVTVSGTGTISIAGARVSGVDYLALGTTTISATSPGEFYAGANSTGGTNAILTAAPAAVTRYWRGGSGTWDATTTTNWSATSGGSGGASVPTSADAVVFDSASNATAYTVTCTATQLRCASFTMAGPATGNVTWAGTAPIAMHGNVSLAATGITRSYTGVLSLSGSGSATITTNGISFAQDTILNGIGSNWSLGSALTLGSSTNLQLSNGTFNTANYNCSFARFFVTPSTGVATLSLGSSTITENTLGFSINGVNPNFILNAGTSTFNNIFSAPSIGNQSPNTLTFYNYNFTNVDLSTATITGANIFNNLSFVGRTSPGISIVSISANQTVNGTLTFSAGTNATMRNFLRSDTIGTTRTLTCAAFAGTDVDFRDITITGAAAPVSGTRLGDCKGNSGITFSAGVNKYWNLAGSNNWSATAWATSAGGAVAVNNFPLAQDTTVFTSTVPATGTTTTINAAYNIGSIDMSARTSNTMTLATGSNTPTIYGNWINGTGTTLSGTGTLTFAGRGSQAITSAGKTFTQGFAVNTPAGSVTLQDAFETNRDTVGALNIQSGTFNANTYNVTISGANATVSSTTTTVRTIGVDSGTWTLAGTSGSIWDASTSTNLTVTGTGTINLTNASVKTFAGGGISYSNITLNQGGAGALNITGNNTFKNITNTYSATGATIISLGTTTQRVTQFTGTGTSGKVLTIQGTSASSPSTLVLTGATKPNVDYLTITGVRAYNLTDTWYAGANSTNNGSLGWIFASGTVALTGFITEGASGADSIAGAIVAAIAAFITEGASGLDEILSSNAFGGSISEAASGLDSQSSNITFTLSIDEAASGLDAIVPSILIEAIVSEAASALEDLGIGGTFNIVVSEVASGQDGISNIGTFNIVITEAATGADILTARLLWEPIDNQQTANWTNITNTQTPGWTDIPTQ
jgi:hypothetical protein